MDHNKIDDVKETSQTCDTSFEVGGDPFTFCKIQGIIEESENFDHSNSDEYAICFDVNCNCNENLMDSNYSNSNEKCSNISKYFLEVILKSSGDNSYSIANNLILDSCGKYTCDINQFVLDGNQFFPNIYKVGILENIYARNSNRCLEFSLCDVRDGCEECSEDEKADTSYGFKLSQIISNLGDLSQITKDLTVNEFGNIEFTQKAVIFSKYNRKHIIFSFKLKNVGSNTASKILFKDVLPGGVCIYDNAIFINGKYVNKDNLSMDGRRIIIKFDDIGADEEIDLIMVGSMQDGYESINCGVLTYVSGFKETYGVKVMSVVQVLSNIKALKLKGCN